MHGNLRAERLQEEFEHLELEGEIKLGVQVYLSHRSTQGGSTEVIDHEHGHSYTLYVSASF